MSQSNKIKGEGKPADGCQRMREHSRAISNSGKPIEDSARSAAANRNNNMVAVLPFIQVINANQEEFVLTLFFSTRKIVVIKTFRSVLYVWIARSMMRLFSFDK